MNREPEDLPVEFFDFPAHWKTKKILSFKNEKPALLRAERAFAFYDAVRTPNIDF